MRLIFSIQWGYELSCGKTEHGGFKFQIVNPPPKKDKRLKRYPSSTSKNHLRVLSMDFSIRHVKSDLTAELESNSIGSLSSNRFLWILSTLIQWTSFLLTQKHDMLILASMLFDCPCCSAHGMHFYSILSPAYFFMKFSLAILSRSYWSPSKPDTWLHAVFIIHLAFYLQSTLLVVSCISYFPQ